MAPSSALYPIPILPRIERGVFASCLLYSMGMIGATLFSLMCSLSHDNTPTKPLSFQNYNTLRHTLTSKPEFINTPYHGRGGRWSVADHREQITMEIKEERLSPLATIPEEPPMEPLPRESPMEASPSESPMESVPPEIPLISLRHLPVPIRQSYLDSLGFPTVEWVPPSRELSFPPPVDSLRGQDYALPSHEQTN